MPHTLTHIALSRKRGPHITSGRLAVDESLMMLLYLLVTISFQQAS
jgi:hypothetical protein